MNKLKLLFTGGGGAGTQLLYETLSDKYEVHFADGSDDLDVISNNVPLKHKHKIPMASDLNFVESLGNLIKKNNIQILIPGVDEELVKINELNNLCPNLKIICPQKSFIEKMLNKKNMSDLFSEHDILSPKSYKIDEIVDGNSYIIKPKVGRGSRGVVSVNSKSQILSYFNLYNKKESECIIQDKIQGDEFTITVSCNKEGNLIQIVPLKILKKKGVTISAVYKPHKNIDKLVSRLCDIFRPKGIMNVQLIEDKFNQLYIFEINPRISTTACFAFYMGCDLVENFDKFNRDNDSKFEKYKFTRTWYNSVSYYDEI